MAKKIQLQDANGNVLHPLTLGECVAMDNGENLDTLMSKSQMFTPTIAQDKSMFKVGTGIDVDYSANVKDGAYESLVFKGKSLVNLITKYRNNNTSQTLTISGRTYVVADRRDMPLKSNTKYLIQFNVSSLNLDGRTSVDLVFQQNAGVIFDGNVTASIVQTGVHSVVATTIPSLPVVTDSDWSQNAFVIKGMASQWENSTSTERTLTISDVMVIEYQQGMENWDIPYFTGICDSKMPILQNVGKNLYEGKDYQRNVEANKPTGDFPLIMSHVKLKKNTDYCISYSYETNTTRNDTTYGLLTKTKVEKLDRHNALYSYHHDGYEGNGKKGNSKQLTQARFNTGDFEYLYFGVNSVSAGQNGYIKYYNIQLEESSSPTPYESHKTNILHTSEEIVLRSLPNGVCDTYNARTGEYVKRIGERTLNGSEAWIANSGTDKQFEDVWVFHNQESLCNGTVRLCDKLQARENANENAEFIRGGGAYIFVYISKNKVQNHNANDFKTWLQSNPLTVQYELAEPVTTIVKPSTMTPFAYQNGHVILESGFEGQSLLPEIEYSVVTGRTGQVTQNTKVLRKQEQQIIGLEELLLTQVVQMEYERTLLQFDYELQMMMLG